MRTTLLIILLLSLGGFSSCMKKKPEELPYKLEWNPQVAIALGTEQIGLNAESGFDTTLFELDTLTDLPYWVEQQVLVLERHMAFDLSALEANLDKINRILFRTSISNGFPNPLLAQGYFVDAAQNIIDSMFSEGPVPVPAGTPIGNGETVDPYTVVQDAIFDKERMTPLEDATEIILRAVIAHPQIDTLLVPYYPNYLIDIEIGIMTDLSLEF